jgi:sporulation protein YlmC with PRC-barrel domain
MSAICGAAVTGPDGEKLGSISELMVDSATGAISYAVLAYGGLLGVGEKLFAIPWRSFRIDPVGNRISLDAPQARLEALPGFDKDAWPTGPDPSFA